MVKKPSYAILSLKNDILKDDLLDTSSIRWAYVPLAVLKDFLIHIISLYIMSLKVSIIWPVSQRDRPARLDLRLPESGTNHCIKSKNNMPHENASW